MIYFLILAIKADAQAAADVIKVCKDFLHFAKKIFTIFIIKEVINDYKQYKWDCIYSPNKDK